MSKILKQTRQGYVDALIELAAEHPEIVVLDADVAKATKTCDFETVYPDRFFNCGTAEQNELSVAAGLSLEGLVPFATTFAMFATTRACDQFRNSICYPKANVKVVGTHAGITTGGDGAPHQCNEDLAITRVMPNLTILVPGDYEEARYATKAAFHHRGPVYLRLGRDAYPVVPELHSNVVIGKAKQLRDGDDLTLVCTGIMVHETLLATDELERSGVFCRVLHFPTIKPLDTEALKKAARETSGFVTVEEHSIIGGLGEAVASALAQTDRPAMVRCVGVNDVFGESGHAPELMDKFGLRARDIIAKAYQILNHRNSLATK